MDLSKLSVATRNVWFYRQMLIVVCVPLLASLLPLFVPGEEAKCLYVVIVIILYWVTEAVPLPVTALLPLALFPALGVSSAKEVAADYLQEPLFLLIGGLIVAVAIEESRLHERIAFRVLLLTGERRSRVILAIMLTTTFMSTWINSTATTATMLPIVKAILEEMIHKEESESEQATSMVILEKLEKRPESAKLLLSHEDTQFCKIMLLSVCYSANIGAIATITSSASNILAVGMIESMYGRDTGVTYASWMSLGLPTALINVIFAWVWLQLRFCGWRSLLPARGVREPANITSSLKRKLHILGGFSWREFISVTLFILLICLWLFRQPGSISGWSRFFSPGYVTDSSAVMVIVFLFFVLPRERPQLVSSNRDTPDSSHSPRPLLDWPTVESRLPWGVVVLAGGSLAMAGAIERSGLSAVFGDHLSGMGHLKPSLVCFFILLLGAYSTEVCSNAAVVSILVPLMAKLAEDLHVNPLYFILSAAIGVNYAFMLPVSTAPNALVYSQGKGLLKLSEMATSGFVMNLLAVIGAYIVMHTSALAVFDFNHYPHWAPMELWNTSKSWPLLGNESNEI